jgi:hypothetical protein
VNSGWTFTIDSVCASPKFDGFINFGNRNEPEFIPIVDEKLFIFVGQDRGGHIGF